ncbi:MAG: glycosyltransferase [Chitinophagaceae bacterium]|jgi:glycosyltransferase involved in cell wall biosynthesis
MGGFYFKEAVPTELMGIRESAEAFSKSLSGILVHDLYHQSNAASIGWLERWKENQWLKKAVKSQEPVFVFTEFTRTALVNFLEIPSERIQIMDPPYSEMYFPTDEDARDVVRYQFTQGDAFFVCRSPLHPACNILSLLKGFSQFKKRTSSNMKLVFTGAQGKFSVPLLSALESYRYKNDIVLIPRPTPVDDVSLISAAYALIHPCRWERFGIPLLNAMQAGVAVLTAENSSMSELTDGAGMYFNEQDPGDIGEKLIRIYNDEQMRNEMIGTGLGLFR